MAEQTKISWAHSSWNPWIGCTKVSDGCKHCYAEALDHRYGGDHWGPGKPRRIFGDKHWAEPRKWDRQAMQAGAARRVFGGSMCDPFDDDAPASERLRYWRLISETPHLVWLLLTKRPENFSKYLPWLKYHLPEPMCRDCADGDGLRCTNAPHRFCDPRTPWPNVWLGVTAEHQAEADRRIPILLSTPAVCRFVSYEPALGPIDFTRIGALHHEPISALGSWAECHECGAPGEHVKIDEDLCCATCGADAEPHYGLDWVIYGDESGPRARPGPDAERATRDACAAAGVPFFYKQRVTGRLKTERPLLDGVRHLAVPRPTNGLRLWWDERAEAQATPENHARAEGRASPIARERAE